MSPATSALPSVKVWLLMAAAVSAAHLLVLQPSLEALQFKKAIPLAPQATLQASQAAFITRPLQASASTLTPTPSFSKPPEAQSAAPTRQDKPVRPPVVTRKATVPLELSGTRSEVAAVAPTPAPFAASAQAPAPAAQASPLLLALNGPENKAEQPPAPAHRAAAARLPASRRLLYEVVGEAKKFPYSAHAELLWQQDGSSYSARLEIAAVFLPSRVQTSAGQLTPQGLAPTRFSDKLRTEVAAHFERDKGKISFSANTPDIGLQPGAQDRLSILLQLGGLLAAEPNRYQTGSSITIQTVGPRDADDWRFVVGAEENLVLADGPHPARKLSRAPQREHDLRVDLWLGLDLGYLPVQLRMTQPNGDFVQLQLKSVENL